MQNDRVRVKAFLHSPTEYLENIYVIYQRETSYISPHCLVQECSRATALADGALSSSS